MSVATADMARAITWGGSKQTYFTGRLVIDRDLVDDFFRAYAYFRWIDDFIDVTSTSDDERRDFITRQKQIIDRSYNHDRPADLVAEEELIADLIDDDRWEQSGLRSFICNMFAIIEFDAYRKGRTISEEELNSYTDQLSISVTDGIQYFIANGYEYPDGADRYSAALASHITHLLRDAVPDTLDGFINIPADYLKTHDIGADDYDSAAYREWVKGRVDEARINFDEGKRYLDGLDVLRCKIAGHWYVARFESVLNTIERDDYTLRAEYNERQNISTWLRVMWLGVRITANHIFRRRSKPSKVHLARGEQEKDSIPG